MSNIEQRAKRYFSNNYGMSISTNSSMYNNFKAGAVDTITEVNAILDNMLEDVEDQKAVFKHSLHNARSIRLSGSILSLKQAQTKIKDLL